MVCAGPSGEADNLHLAKNVDYARVSFIWNVLIGLSHLIIQKPGFHLL